MTRIPSKLKTSKETDLNEKNSKNNKQINIKKKKRQETPKDDTYSLKAKDKQRDRKTNENKDNMQSIKKTCKE